MTPLRPDATAWHRKVHAARNRLRYFMWRYVIPTASRVNHWLIAQAAKAGIRLLRLLPPDRALDSANRAARALGPWFGRHRTAVANLRRAYPERSTDEIEALARDMWGHMARLAAEYIFLETLFEYDAEDESRGRIEVVGKDNFLRMAAESDRPHIIFTAHLGSFELLPMACALHGTPLTTLFRPPNNPYIAEFLLSKRTSAMGDLLASGAGAAFTLAAVLEKGGNVGALVDQKFRHGVRTTFFGQPCESNPIVPMLARRFDCDVYPARCIRLPGNRYRLEMEAPLMLPRTGDGDIDVAAATQQITDVVERWVREEPAQWMWFHKRWKLSGPKRRRRIRRRPAAATNPLQKSASIAEPGAKAAPPGPTG